MSAIGFSAHTPLPFENAWSMDNDLFLSYCEEIRSLGNEFRDRISIYLSLELDYLPNSSYSFQEMKSRGCLDYTIGSVHLVSRPGREGLWFLDGPESNYSQGVKTIFDGDIKMAVTRYFELVKLMLITQKPDLVGHIDKVKMNNQGVFFSEDDAWYKRLIDDTLNTVAISKAIVEVNTRGIYKKKSADLFPGLSVLERCYKLGIPVTISTDAHQPGELLCHFDETRLILKDVGYREVMVYKDQGWRGVRL